MDMKRHPLNIGIKVQITSLIVTTVITVSLFVFNIWYTNYKFDQNNKTKLLVSCEIPSNSIGYGDSQSFFLNLDVICRIANISMKKVSIDKIESGNTDDDEKWFNLDETQEVASSSSEKTLFPKLLDINQQERYLVQVRLPLYGNKNAQVCLTTNRQEIKSFAKCFLDNKFSVDTFSNNIETLPNLAVRVITADQEKFITKISLRNSFYFYDKEKDTWTYGLSNPVETWSYSK